VAFSYRSSINWYISPGEWDELLPPSCAVFWELTVCVDSVHWFKAKENMMRIQRTETISVLGCRVHVLRRCIIAVVAFLTWNETFIMSHNLAKVGHIEMQTVILDWIADLSLPELRSLARKYQAANGVDSPGLPEQHHSLQWSGMPIWGVPELLRYSWTSCGFAMNQWAHVSYSDTEFQHSYRLCWLRPGIGKYALTVMTICAQVSREHLNFDYIPVIDVRLPQISKLCLTFWHKYLISPW
jgi:hypothetical protein